MIPFHATPFDHDVLIAAADTLGIVLSSGQANSLLSYLKLIQKWTKTYNLTAVRDPADMVTHHLLEIGRAHV